MYVLLCQVHVATLHDGRAVAMKVQYPGVARGIESDVDNLMRLISIANILPKGMYVEEAVKVRTPWNAPQTSFLAAIATYHQQQYHQHCHICMVCICASDAWYLDVAIEIRFLSMHSY